MISTIKTRSKRVQNPFRTEHSLRRWLSYKHEVHTRNSAGGGPKPHHINPATYGQHLSFVENGLRKWKFENGMGFLRFCEEHKDRIEYRSPVED
jgi:hypothetical protein